MGSMHKKTISCCIKDPHGRVLGEGMVTATRQDLDAWMKSLPQPWTVAMEATATVSISKLL
jgi:transposase